MKGISISGMKLHEVMMPLMPYPNCNSVVSLRYPKHRIEFEQNGDAVNLIVPPMLALEMYRIGILPQDEKISFPVSISGRKIGNFRVIKFLYPNTDSHAGKIFITLHKQ
jgi:hypothetical protein